MQSAKAEDCYDTANTQLEMNNCAADHLGKAEKRLGDILSELEKKYDSKTYGKLLSASKAWEEYRDLYCDYEGSGVEEGSIQPMIRLDCRTQLTNQHLKLLERQLNCQEGDLSCVVY